MTRRSVTQNLYDPRHGDPPICTRTVQIARKPIEPPRTNYFGIYRIDAGAGQVCADAAQFAFRAPCLIFLVPYQYVRFVPDSSVVGDVLRFHANFLCVETFHAEVGCSSILFNDPYGTPIVPLDKPAASAVKKLCESIREEESQNRLASRDVMLAYLKVLLILATRLKTPAAQACASGAVDLRHPVLSQFRELIEQNFGSLHSPADYARRMHVTAKTLGRIVREQLGTTPTDLIRSRILTHAKWQLLHTLKPVKQISRELGFRDELYFSRLFKKATGLSPVFFREFETEIRGGSNLSISSGHAPILQSAAASDS